MSTTSSYDALREAIVRGEIAPNARLVEADVSTEFAMSRGAVRTALIRLEQEGLVVREPHRGARVRPVSDEEAVEILEARAVLEGLAVRMTAERIDDEGAKRVQACLTRQRELLELGDLLGASDANADLHATLLELSGHDTAAEAHQRAQLAVRPLPVPDDPHSGPLRLVGRRAHGDRGRRRPPPAGARGERHAHPPLQCGPGPAPGPSARRYRHRKPRCSLTTKET